ncbi:MAG: hypothetical protein NTV93_03480 [Verrucomicrobia bacterium]|nr:hypothetical protein [Verrucomicrobiota bacterium]
MDPCHGTISDNREFNLIQIGERAAKPAGDFHAHGNGSFHNPDEAGMVVANRALPRGYVNVRRGAGFTHVHVGRL